ncbi:hypothetical protein [Paenibacillus sp. QZ-Y1]|uniref:hypothetical protein n=1 Tax=Paenibacillus sp. QZ-Y1 TaxID=3414511 RepID=UPI003F7914A1
MKAVPKVNIDGLYLEDELVDGAFSGVVPFYNTDSEEETVEGYIVGVPLPPGLFHPLFNLKLWELTQDSPIGDLWIEGLSSEEIDKLKQPPIKEPSATDLLGEQLVAHELDALQLQQQNEILGNQIVQRELENEILRMQNEALGAQIVGVELRLLSMEGEQNV